MALSHSPRIVTDGLVLCLDAANKRSYPGSGTTWTDLSTTGASGVLTNGPTFDAANGGSVVFDGTNDYVYLGTQLESYGDGAISIFAWARRTSTTPVQSILSNCHPGGAAQDWTLEWGRTDGKFGVLWGNQVILTSSQSFVANSWYYCGYTRSGSSGNWACSFYVNGILDSTTTGVAFNPSATNVGASIGRLGDVSLHYLNGKVAYAQFYNRALTANEVRRNYLATKGRF